MAEANYFKKRSPRISRSRLSYSSASEDDGKGPIAVPEGLRAILNEIAREVRLILLIGIFFYKNCKLEFSTKLQKFVRHIVQKLLKI